jgi:hypothetical protein
LVVCVLLGVTALSAVPIDSGGTVIPATWVYDAVEKNGVMYFTAESSSSKGVLFRLQNDTTAVKVKEFGAACLSLGFVSDTFFLGVGGTGRVLKSKNSGVSWDTTFIPDGVANVWKVCGLVSGALWIGTGNSYGDVFRSYYGQTTGGFTMSGPNAVRNVRLHSGTLYACTDHGANKVWRSTDQGASWSGANWVLPGSVAYDLFWDSETLYAGLDGSNGLRRSSDGGSTWDSTFKPAGASDVYSIIRSQNKPIWIGTGNSYGDVFRANYAYALGGVNISGPSTMYNVRPHAGVLYACTDHGTNKVWKTTDNGVTWNGTNWVLPGTTAYDLLWDSETLYVGLNGGNGLRRSSDGGSSWDSTFMPDGASGVYLIIHPQGRPIWIGTGNSYGDVFQANYKYALGGAVLSGPTCIHDVVPRNANEIWVGAGAGTGQIWKSLDGGTTWQFCPSAPWSNTYALAFGEYGVYAATDNQGDVYVSYDDGNTWRPTGDLSGASAVYCLKMGKVTFLGKLIAGTGNNGDVFRSDQFVAPGRYEVVNLNPNPNPPTSSIMQGGRFHRYYLVVDEQGNPAPWVTVVARCETDVAYFVADADGIVDINFPTAAQPPGTVLQGAIQATQGRSITPVPFAALVTARRYDRAMDFDGSLEAGAGALYGARVMLDDSKVIRLNGTSSQPDSLKVVGRTSLGACPRIGGTIGVGLNVANRRLGANISGEVYAGGAIFDEGNYHFGWPVPQQQYLDAAALYVMLTPYAFVKMSEPLVHIAQYLSGTVQTPLDVSLEKGKAGIDIFAGGEGNASVGLVQPSQRGANSGNLAGFGATASIGAEMHANMAWTHKSPDESGVEAGVSGEVHPLHLNLDYNFAPSPTNREVVKDLPAKLGIYEWSAPIPFLFDGMLDCGFGFYFNSSGPTRFMIYLTKMTEAGETQNTETYEFWFDADDIQTLRDFVSGLTNDLMAGTAGQLSLGQNVSLFQGRPESFARSFYAVFERALDFQETGRNLHVNYYKCNGNSLLLLPLQIGIEAGLGVNAELGASGKVRNEKTLLTEEGIWSAGRMYRLYEYADDNYTQERGDVAIAPIQLTAQVINGIISSIFDWVKNVMPHNFADSLTLQVGTGKLVVRQGGRPAGDSVAVVHWVWIPESSDNSRARGIRLHQQAVTGLDYGIGGFYLVQPETAHVQGKARLMVAYSDSELVGINENSLALYRWDTLLRKWAYVGGRVHADSNFVEKDSLQLFGLYTLAPAAPADTFALRAVPDSVPANGTSVVTCSGGPIRLSNGGLVPDSALITVASSAGTITTPDADTTIPGIQVRTTGGNMSFQVRAPDRATRSTVTAASVLGSAIGVDNVLFYDTGRPLAPVLVSVVTQDSVDVRATWRSSPSVDVIGYWLHYDSDTVPPYGGQSPHDLPSPIDVGLDTARTVGLSVTSDTTYYVCVTAYDVAGQQSIYSNVIAVGRAARVDGGVRYYSGSAPVESALVHVTGYENDTVATDMGGRYLLGLPIAHDYTVLPFKKESSRQPAVSAFDAALVMKHVVRRDTLDSLQFRAGDVSGDSTVSAFDAGLILQYAVGRIRHFPAGNRGGGDTVDWAFRPPQRVYDSLTSNQVNQDYRGILYGDPSGNWPGVALPSFGRTADGGSAVFFGLNLLDDVTTDRLRPAPTITGHSLGAVPVSTDAATTSEVPRLPCFARNDNTTTRSAVGGERSAVLCFPIMVKDAAGASSADMLVRYDTRRYRLTGVRTTPQTEGFMVAAVGRNGEVRIALAGARKLKGEVTLLDLVFEPARSVDPQITPITQTEGSDNRNSGSTGERRQTPTSPLPQSSPQGGEERSRGWEAALTEGALGGEPLAASRQPLADVVWLVLDERAPQRLAVPSNVEGSRTDLPKSFYLSPPAPNPFGTGTLIAYGLPEATNVRVAVFDALGRMVTVLAGGPQTAGRYAVTWHGTDNQGNSLANGLYFIRLAADDQRFQRKVVLAR